MPGVTTAGPAAAVATRLAALHQLIEAAGRDPASVRIVGVTKGHGPEACEAALSAGVTDLGESYAQELLAKAADARLDGARWHFVGGLQARKVRSIAGVVHLWHSIDRPKLVHELVRWAPGARVLVQVRLSDEPGKAGCVFDEVPSLVAEAARAGLVVEGLMGVGPTAGGADAARPGFRRLARTAADLGLETVSMGMSADLAVALAEGATVIRMGTALFGPRPARAAVRAWGQ